MKSVFSSVALLVFSLNSAHAFIGAQSYIQSQCDEGKQPSSILFSETESGLRAQWNDGQVENFEKINQGAQESYKFIALALQYRIVTTVTADEDSINKTEKTYGHLIGSPLGFPRDTKIVNVSAGANDNEIQVSITKLNGFGLSLEKSVCSYYAE